MIHPHAETPARPLVLQVLYSGLGGHSAVATTLVEAGGADDPWRHHFLFYGIEPVAPGYVEICDRLGIPYDYVQASEGRPWAAWSDLARCVRAISPDAVILHSIKTTLPMRHAMSRSPLIAVEHQPNALKSKSEWIASASAQLLADRVVMLSKDYTDTMRRRLGPLFSEARTTIVPTGIDLSPFLTASTPARTGNLRRIGMAARFSPTKAQESLVEAIVRLIRTRPEIDWRLSLAGDGVRHAGIAQAVNAAGLDSIVELPGNIPPADLPEWFRSIDIYAHSSDGETLSTALLQAMAAGLPIVASDVPGISDLLGPHNENELPPGRLVPARDVTAFANAIAALADSPDDASTLANRAREYVLLHHSPEVMRAGYSRILDDLWHVRSST